MTHEQAKNTLNRVSHTPGPWHYVHNKRMGYFQICDTAWHEKGETSLITSIDSDQPHGLSDAKLIAAAPDILDCLYAIKSTVHFCEFSDPLKKQVLDAIVKAGGKA